MAKAKYHRVDVRAKDYELLKTWLIRRGSFTEAITEFVSIAIHDLARKREFEQQFRTMRDDDGFYLIDLSNPNNSRIPVEVTGVIDLPGAFGDNPEVCATFHKMCAARGVDPDSAPAPKDLDSFLLAIQAFIEEMKSEQ